MISPAPGLLSKEVPARLAVERFRSLADGVRVACSLCLREIAPGSMYIKITISDVPEGMDVLHPPIRQHGENRDACDAAAAAEPVVPVEG